MAAAPSSSIPPKDLSCYWNQAERSPTNTAVILATRVGQNIVDYATGRELPADKLVVREVHDFKVAPVQRNALRIAELLSTPASGTSHPWPSPISWKLCANRRSPSTW